MNAALNNFLSGNHRMLKIHLTVKIFADRGGNFFVLNLKPIAGCIQP